MKVQHEVDPRRGGLDTYWIQLHDGKGLVEADGWASDARLAVVRRNDKGKVVRCVLVEGKQLTQGGEDLSAKAHKPRPKAIFVLKKAD